MNSVELSWEKWYLSLGASAMLSLSHWNTTLVPFSTEQRQVTFALSSTTADVGLFSMTGEDTGTEEETGQSGWFMADFIDDIKLVTEMGNTHRPLLHALFSPPWRPVLSCYETLCWASGGNPPHRPALAPGFVKTHWALWRPDGCGTSCWWSWPLW